MGIDRTWAAASNQLWETVKDRLFLGTLLASTGSCPTKNEERTHFSTSWPRKTCDYTLETHNQTKEGDGEWRTELLEKLCSRRVKDA